MTKAIGWAVVVVLTGWMGLHMISSASSADDEMTASLDAARRAASHRHP